jgi:hypothetical protein
VLKVIVGKIVPIDGNRLSVEIRLLEKRTSVEMGERKSYKEDLIAIAFEVRTMDASPPCRLPTLANSNYLFLITHRSPNDSTLTILKLWMDAGLRQK